MGDWIPMEKIKSIRISLLLYVGFSLLAGLLCYIMVLTIIDHTLLDLLNPRPEAISFVAGRNIFINFEDGNKDIPNIINPRLFDLIKLFRTISPIIIFSFCIIIGVILFYRNVMQKPLTMLNIGITKISAQDLNFSINFETKNELGQLCEAFECMRQELSQTFQSLWVSEENQRNLYRAFSHDLRTPLTIIKGNNNNIEFVAVKNNDWKLALQAVRLSNHAIERIELYTEQLRKLESLDDWQYNPQNTDLNGLTELIVQQATVICNQYNKQITCSIDVHGQAHVDTDMLQRILDNLLMNARLYAHQTVYLTIKRDQQKLFFAVSDDGPGFTPEAIKQGIAPFYSSRRIDGHAGIGLTISQKLLEKFPSTLYIRNTKSEGAHVSFTLLV